MTETIYGIPMSEIMRYRRGTKDDPLTDREIAQAIASTTHDFGVGKKYKLPQLTPLEQRIRHELRSMRKEKRRLLAKGIDLPHL